MYFGTTVGERHAFALLDRYVEAGGRLIDTANNYAFWADGGTGDESETVLGKWLRSRGHRDEISLATKVGARPRPGGHSLDDAVGLSAAAVRDQVEASLRRLGVDQLDLLYAHIDDTQTPLEQTLAAFDDLVGDGLVRAVACSNLTLPRLREAHDISERDGLARYEATQLRATYLSTEPDADIAPQVLLDDDLARYAAAQDMAVFGYSPLLGGAYVRADRPVPPEYQHGATGAQLGAVQASAARLGATANQIVLAWLSEQGVVPVLGVSSLAQLDEALAAREVKLDEHSRRDLTRARRLGGPAAG